MPALTAHLSGVLVTPIIAVKIFPVRELFHEEA